jgi:hypothetical protein
MSKIKLKNVNAPTPAKWVKVGASLTSASAFIAGYGLTMEDQFVGFFGLGIGVVGTVITTLMGD